MKLYMKADIWSNFDEFTVKDQFEEDRYYIHGDFVVIGGKKIHIEDMKGHELALVHQKLFALLPRFFVYRDGQQVAEIRKKISLFKAKYVVEGPGWDVTGSILDHDYTISKDGREIVSIHKAWLSWGSSYELDIADDADEVLVVAVVFAIDLVMWQEAQQAMENTDTP